MTTKGNRKPDPSRHFDSGIPCKHDGSTMRYINGGRCVECLRRYNLAIVTADPVAWKARVHDYRDRERAKVNAHVNRYNKTRRVEDPAWYAARLMYGTLLRIAKKDGCL